MERPGTHAILMLLALLSAILPTRVFGAPAPPSPLDRAHLIVLTSESIVARGPAPVIESNPSAAFGKAVKMGGPFALRVPAKFEGEYELWVRVSRPAAPAVVELDLTRKGIQVLHGTANQGEGSPTTGGPAGFDAYASAQAKAAGNARVESPGKPTAFYWWRVGVVPLQPGVCTLRLTPPAGNDQVLFDCAILTTARLVYPFTGDLTLPRASYIRFRIDALPPAGKLTISGRFLTHVPPQFYSAVGNFGPTGLATAPAPHIKTGYTPWYCLQDLSNAPPLDATDVTLLLQLSSPPNDGARGVTQLANYPQHDSVVGEFDWAEPESLSISMDMDFEKALDKLRNIRDQAREHYDMAMAATGGKIHPLTRGPLYFSHGWGMARGATFDYELKTLRTLGFNVATIDEQPGVPNTREGAASRYGWGVQLPVWAGGPVTLDLSAAKAKIEAAQVKNFSSVPPGLASRAVMGQIADEVLETVIAPNEQGHAAFRKWAMTRGLTPETFAVDAWDKVKVVQAGPGAIQDAASRRMYYWTRRFQSDLNSRWYDMIGQAILSAAPNKAFRPYVALGGHQLYFPGAMPQDLFALGSFPSFMGGISDWMTQGSWRWDSHQVVAFSMAFFNAGGRRYGQSPASFPMSHTAWPSAFRAYTLLANQAKLLSFWTFGPVYASPEGDWSEAPESYRAVSLTANRATYFDDILPTAAMRPSRVAMLYSHAADYWSPGGPAFADKHATFLGLSHDYFQPELVTEDQVAQGCLSHYDAFYVLDVTVAEAARVAIAKWVESGGMLWACADAMTANEYFEATDALAGMGLKRQIRQEAPATAPSAVVSQQNVTTPLGSISAVHVKAMEAAVAAGANASATPTGPTRIVQPVADGPAFRPHSVAGPAPAEVSAQGVTVRAKYDNGDPAWVEARVGKGRLIYLAHRAGLTYSAKAVRLPGWEVAWAETGRAPLIQPLLEAKVARELTLSEPTVMANPLSTPEGTVIPIYNMNPYPLTGLTLRLRESKAPSSVVAFDPRQPGPPVPIDSTFADGVLTIQLPWALPAEEGAQMVCVRRVPPSKDDRTELLKKHVQRLLASDNAADLSAGAYFAGAFPEWGFEGLLVPLLENPDWTVRRQAVESIAKLNYRAVRERLEALVATETDSHVLGDCVVALAKLDSFNALSVCLEQMESKSPFVRKQSLIAANLLVDRRLAEGRLTGVERNNAFQIVEAGLTHRDPRVRQPAIQLFAKLAPEEAFDRLAAAARPGGPPLKDADTWAYAIASNDLLFQKWLEAQRPGGVNFLLRVSLARPPSTAIADAIRQAIDTARPEDALDEALLLQAIPRQQSRALMRTVYEKRGRIPFGVLRQMTRLLETVYRARLGGVGADWDAWLRENPD